MNLGLPLVLVVLALAVVYFARHREVGARAGFLRWTGFGPPGWATDRQWTRFRRALWMNVLRGRG